MPDSSRRFVVPDHGAIAEVRGPRRGSEAVRLLAEAGALFAPLHAGHLGLGCRAPPGAVALGRGLVVEVGHAEARRLSLSGVSSGRLSLEEFLQGDGLVELREALSAPAFGVEPLLRAVENGLGEVLDSER